MRSASIMEVNVYMNQHSQSILNGNRQALSDMKEKSRLGIVAILMLARYY